MRPLIMYDEQIETKENNQIWKQTKTIDLFL